MTRHAMLTACLLLATLPAVPALAAPAAPAVVAQNADEAGLRAALGGEGDTQARAGLIALLLRQRRDTEIAGLLPPTSSPEGLAEARSLLCQAMEAADALGAQDVNERFRSLLPQAALHVGDGVTRPEILDHKRPEYTDDARAAKLSGTVILSAVIGETGKVDALDILKGLPMGLDTAAEEAVREWTFKPATLDGVPVAVCYSLTVNFQVD